MVLGTVAAATAAGLSGLAYLDAKFHFRKDLTGIRRLSRGMEAWQNAVKSNRMALYYFFQENAAAMPEREAIWSREGCYTWIQLLERVNQYGWWYLSQGVRPGDFVALMMVNSPDFVLAWIGLWSIGAAPAMINHNLVGPPLKHCLKISTAKLVLVSGGEDVLSRINAARPDVEALGIKIVNLADVRAEITGLKSSPPGEEVLKNVKQTDPYGLFYTSGTTGMPKALVMPLSFGYIGASGTRIGASDLDPETDRYYNCMPYYHGTGGFSIVGQLMNGITVCIAPKFRVSTFWEDVRDSNATFFVYVGETLRYLLTAPPSARDKDHKIHTIIGNGLRPDVWKPFRDRFGITQINEFFNSTEAMLGLSNSSRGDYTAEAVGHHGLIMRLRTYDTIVPVAIDPETGDLLRDPTTGFATRVPYEIGGEILVPTAPKPFGGYFNNKEATEKKLVRDVFKKGDCYYRTGDALRRDLEGRWYFMDRLGDTFRWKGENVSTAEVSEALGRYPGVLEAIVYGVPLPGHDGKAGVAAIYIEPAKKDSFDHAAFLQYARSQLPKFAVPVFVRHLQTSRLTHNNKQDKEPLKREGIHPEKIGVGDKLFWVDGNGKGSTYVPFEMTHWSALNTGKAKL